MALQLVKRDTQTTARHACQVLQAAEDELTEVESAEYKHLRRVYDDFCAGCVGECHGGERSLLS